MKAKDIHYSTVHPDCPFTKEQIDEFRAMLYGVASANNLAAHPSWWVGYNTHQIRNIGKHKLRRNREPDNGDVSNEIHIKKSPGLQRRTEGSRKAGDNEHGLETFKTTN